MRYGENKERSAELLRLVLPLMAQQSAAFHPLSYTLWYEHVAGVNPSLSRVLSAHLQTGSPLTEQEVHRLHAQHVMARDVEALERLQEQLRALLAETARTAANAGVEAGQFGQALEQHKAQLSEASGVDVSHMVAELLKETVRMQATTQSLTEKLQASAQEVSTLNERLQRAQTEALIDPLTGLKNRRGLERALADTFGEAAPLPGAALLVADIDHFKKINDTYGHLLGDKVIRAVAQVIHDNIKGRDIAARIGGEEFAVLLPETSAQGAAALAEQIRVAVSRGRLHRGEHDEVSGSVTLSVGVAVGRAGETLETLMQRADEALYAAKKGGRNRVHEARSSAAPRLN